MSRKTGANSVETSLALVQYVVYDHPLDAPESWVVREWRIHRGASAPIPGPIVAMTSTLALARVRIPPGLTNIGRYPDDDPAIHEVWT